jgi:hypothetical protein
MEFLVLSIFRFVQYRRLEGATALKKFQNLLFNLLLVLGYEKNIIKKEVGHLKVSMI